MNAVARPPLEDAGLLKEALFCGGQWMQAASGARRAVTDPASGALIAHVPNAGAVEAQAAIDAAAAAFAGWREQTAARRATLLKAWHRLIVQHAEDLARLLTAEQGKPLAEARGEIAIGAAYVEWFAEEARRARGETIASPWPDRRIVVLRQPVGVCAAITPWNFPHAMITRKVAPALAMGCSVVLKPAEQTPLSALALAELAQRAGLPDGVFNVVTGDPRTIGATLMASPVVRKLSFTGSTAVGRLLMAQAAPTLKRLSLELGGNAPFIVFDDADLDAAVEGAIASKFRNAGQTCVCANRLFVQRGVHDEFSARLARRVAALKVGAGRDAGVEIGPLIDERALAKVAGHVDDALTLGARLLTGGQRHALGGTWFEPTVLTGVRPGMRCFDEETFGPLAPIVGFEDDDEAVALANATEYGLAGYFYSRDVGRIWKIAERLECGMVGVNTGILTTEVVPFGGVKQSGVGREGSHEGCEEYLDTKYVCLGL